MPQVGIIRENAILPFTAQSNMTGKEGMPVFAVPGGIDIIDEDTMLPIGVLVTGAGNNEQVSVAIAAGGLTGTVRVKLNAPVMEVGEYLCTKIGPGGAYFAPDARNGERVIMAQALETGLAGEKIEAVLFKPEYFGS